MLASRVFCSASHLSAAFLRHRVKLKDFQLLHAAHLQLINVSSKAVKQSEELRGGASVLFIVVIWH